MRQSVAPWLLAFLAISWGGSAFADDDRIDLEKILVLDPVARYGRSATHIDLMEGRLVKGRFQRPKAGQRFESPGLTGARQWRTLDSDKKGWLQHKALRGGYAYAGLSVPSESVYIMRQRGPSMVYVNGEPRAGNPYNMHPHPLPVLLNEGSNDFLFQVSRGRMKVSLHKAPAPVFLDPHDITSPDYIVGETKALKLGVVIVNATLKDKRALEIEVSVGGATARSGLPFLPRLTALKVPVTLPALTLEEARDLSAKLRVIGESALGSLKISLKARRASELHKRTFLSGMDSSVQYFATRPASGKKGPGKALILSLHGAGVEAWGQAAAYSSKSWGHIVAATNRRPFGFDWEDWGRRDAIEVLERAQKIYRTDRSRTYLTGHSMGGHGTWQVGATYPDRFAAIAPSAGWISFWSYGGARRSKAGSVAGIFQRAMSGSDTLGLSQNYKGFGIYILHGGGDRNVPPGQARTMVKHLGAFHKNFRYHEEPKVGHWWDKDHREPGADCVDWGPMFDFFVTQRRPGKSELKRIDFSTANPSISADHRWLRIESQQNHGALSRAQVRVGAKGFYGETKNIAKLSLDLSVLPKQKSLELELDGGKQSLPWPEGQRLTLVKSAKGWSPGRVLPSEKNPVRYGPFKEAFGNQVILVYGTGGSAEENRWALAKARYDSETFMYRGNGTLRLVADKDFDAGAKPESNVVLYGHKGMNSAWVTLLRGCPIEVTGGRCLVGEKVVEKKDLATLFVWPRAGTRTGLVGVVAGTSLVGMRVTERCPYFVSGVAYPDLTILTPESPFRGDEGVVVTGYFGHDWSVKSGQFAWKN